MFFNMENITGLPELNNQNNSKDLNTNNSMSTK